MSRELFNKVLLGIVAVAFGVISFYAGSISFHLMDLGNPIPAGIYLFIGVYCMKTLLEIKE